MKTFLYTIAFVSIIFGFITLKWGCDEYVAKKKEFNPDLYENHTLSYMADLGQYYSGTTLLFFTLSTVIFVVLSFKNQQEQLKDQRTANINQQKEISFNRFENTFFKMMDLYQSIIVGMKISRYRTTPTTGGTGITQQNTQREVFETLYWNDLKQYINTHSVGRERIEKIKDGYKQFDGVFQDNLGNYFRNLYAILKFIENNIKSGTITPKQSYFYIIMIRGQLSNYELLITFYNGLSEYGDEGFRDLLIKVGFFKHIDVLNLLKYTDFLLYPERAYDLPHTRPEDAD